ncbi:MAG: hypothetical protein J2P23_05985 [Microlunatus sp.]|nr:hypothetical protein [Microlunatus sp.]
MIGRIGVRRRPGTMFLHWVAPIIGCCIIGFVLWNAEPAAGIGGVSWLVVGIGVLIYYARHGIGILRERRAEVEDEIRA